MKKKLSVAIRKGEKIATMSPEEILKGYRLRHKDPSKDPYHIIKKTFLGANKKNACLGRTPIDFVWRKNDIQHLPPNQIADELAACGL